MTMDPTSLLSSVVGKEGTTGPVGVICGQKGEYVEGCGGGRETTGGLPRGGRAELVAAHGRPHGTHISCRCRIPAGSRSSENSFQMRVTTKA